MPSETTPLVSQPLLEQPPMWRIYFELGRFHKLPAGAILMFSPSAWALTLAACRVQRPPMLLLQDTMLYLIGSTLFHSAACVINDICDRDIDRQVERTKNRPLASGYISVTSAVVFLFALLLPCISLLALTDSFTIRVGLFGVFPIHALYPLMKRVTYWPQAWLGLAMNWGILVSWSQLLHQTDIAVPLVLFFGSACWTIVYDTIYGCQDREDDVKVGVKSTSLLFGDHVRLILSFFAAAFVLAVAYAGILNSQGPLFFIIGVGGTSLHLAWQLITLKPDVPEDCWVKFKANGTLGIILWAGILADYTYVMVA